MYEAFVNGRLAKGEWTHDAHVTACWITLQERSPEQALTFLRDAICAHNCGVGTPNNEADGYHETITRYYITAMSQSSATTLDEALADETLGRGGPLAYWTKDRLMSSEARLGWLAPDRAELAWPIVTDD